MSFFGWRRREKLTGTGLAQPKRKPASIKLIAGTRIVPTRSMCLSGLSVMRPAAAAVMSPK